MGVLAWMVQEYGRPAVQMFIDTHTAPAPVSEPVYEKEPDMKANDAFPGTYLKKEDVDPPVIAAIADVQFGSVKEDDGTEKQKVIMSFEGDALKPMVVNKTNWNILEAACGEDSDMWKGQKIELYNDPTVPFGGKIVGGIRVRIPQRKQLTQAEALALCAENGIDKAAFVAALAEKNGKNAEGKVTYSSARDSEFVYDLVANHEAEL